MAGRIGAAAAWSPWYARPWQLRFVIAVICVVQSAGEGHTVYGLIAGTFIALTYLVPAANRTIARRVEHTAGTFLLQHGPGAVLVSPLDRGALTCVTGTAAPNEPQRGSAPTHLTVVRSAS